MVQKADWKENREISTDSCGPEFSVGGSADSGTAKDGGRTWDGMEVQRSSKMEEQVSMFLETEDEP